MIGTKLTSDNNIEIVYIAGYGRSGSTILERVMSSHDKIFGAGEIFIIEKADVSIIDKMKCSCGELLNNCPFWSGVLNEVKQPDTNDKESLIFYKSIFSHVPQNTAYVIDSSKTARYNIFRPLSLKRILKGRIRIIHLVRDGRGCMWSNLRGSNRQIEKGADPHINLAALRTAINWPLANLAAHLSQVIVGSSKYIRVRYEDFTDYPAETMERIAEFLSLDFSEQIHILENNINIPLGHQLAGNRIRLKDEVKLTADYEWHKKLKGLHRLIFWLFGWPFALIYKYR